MKFEKLSENKIKITLTSQDLKDKNMYDSFVNKCKEISLYETNQTPIYGNKIITLSTCEYSTQNSRLVIVAYQI